MASVVSPEQPQKRTLAQKKQAAILVAILVLLFANLFLQRATLVDQLSLGVTLLSGLGGLALGLWMSVRLSKMPSTQSETRRIIGLAGIPIFSIFIGTYFARTAAAELAFVGYSPAIQVVEATVIDFRTGRKWPGHYASFKIDNDSREIEAKVSSGVYANLDPWRSPGRDCLLIEVQRGRGSLRRTILPNAFDEALGIDRYRRCSSTP
jgi:hypothetical protein